MKWRGFPILSILFLLLLSCASGHREPYTDNIPPSRDLVSLEEKLRALCAGSTHLELDDIGRIEYEEFSAAIWIARHRPPCAERYVLITGGVHGNEPAGASWVVDLIAMMARHPEAFSNVNFDLIPLVNPWGWSRDIRFNRRGQDINRDFASFETQEARILKKEFVSRRYDLVIDHHEDPDAAGFYLYQYAKRDTGLSRKVIAAIRALDYPIEQDVHMVILRTRDGLIDAPRWGLNYMRMTGQLSITNYLRLEHSREVYTIETPTRLPMEDRVMMHRRAFELILEGVLR
jgi:hypothetical protein